MKRQSLVPILLLLAAVLERLRAALGQLASQ